MGAILAGAAWLAAIVVVGDAAAAQRIPAQSLLDVCVVPSATLPLDGREREIAAAEANTIWSRFGVRVRWTSASDETCEREILVRPDTDAFPGEVAHDAAIGWVPFVEGRARRLVFLRLDRARRLIAALDRGSRPAAMSSMLFARFIGRGLAHELGHVLLNSMDHPPSGLMRARFRAADVLHSPARSYTLNSTEHAALLTAIRGEVRLAAR